MYHSLAHDAPVSGPYQSGQLRGAVIILKGVSAGYRLRKLTLVGRVNDVFVA